MDRVDVDKVVDRVDVDKILDRVDVDRLVDRVDLDRLLAKVDLDELLARVNVNAVADGWTSTPSPSASTSTPSAMHTDIGAMIAARPAASRATRGTCVRSQAVGLDEWIARWVARLLRRDAPAQRPHFGGAVSRFVAYVVDLGVSTGVFMLALAAVSFAAKHRHRALHLLEPQ